MPDEPNTPNTRPPIVYLQEWRKALQLTQTQLADKIGRSQTHVLNKENKKREASLRDLYDFAMGLGIPWHFLLRPPPSKLEELTKKLTPNDMEKLLAIISELAQER